jgi:hypothetical protein
MFACRRVTQVPGPFGGWKEGVMTFHSQVKNQPSEKSKGEVVHQARWRRVHHVPSTAPTPYHLVENVERGGGPSYRKDEDGVNAGGTNTMPPSLAMLVEQRVEKRAAGGVELALRT